MVATGRIAAAAQTDTLCYHSTPHLPVRLVGNGATRVPENVSLVRIWTASTGWAKNGARLMAIILSNLNQFTNIFH